MVDNRDHDNSWVWRHHPPKLFRLCHHRLLIVITVLYMAVPLGIIGNAFTQTWNDRDRILLTQRTRERLRQWGYEANDIPILFHAFNEKDNEAENCNEGGCLNIDEF